MARTVTCDKCGAEISVEVKEQRIDADQNGEIIEQYFDCPFCGKRYTITITDGKMRKEIKQRQETVKSIHAAFGKGVSTRRLIGKDNRLKVNLQGEDLEMRRRYLGQK